MTEGPASSDARDPEPRWSPTARLRALLALLAAAATVAVLTSSWGRYVGDNRFEQYWAPARRIARSFSTWDGSRGLGRVREDLWPGATAPIAGLRGLGLPPWLAEHLWHGLLLAVAGAGAVFLVRAFRPRIGAEHLLAGALYAFGPYAATFLVPSNLFLTYALCPWLVLALVEGTGGDATTRRRSAAAFALLVFAAGNTDPPGLLFCGLPLLVTALYLVLVDRSVSWGRLGRWVGLAAVLSLATSAAALAKVWISADAFAQRLGDTELPDIANLASSWSESWRGTGFWLSYFREQGELARPQGEVLFVSTVVVLATFVPAVVALATVWLSRWRARVLFGGMALLSLVVMVGAYPTDDPYPFGDAVLWAYERITLLSAFRGAYKAGAGLVLGTAVLFGVGVAAVAARARARWRPLGAGVVGAALAVVAVAGAPFWTASLYDRDLEMGDVPAYWDDALQWLDDQPGEGRVLVLPGSTRTDYRWGWTGDDIFDALLARPHAVDTAIPLSTPEAADLLAALSERISDDTYVEGSLPAIARRLGIERVVIRNDLDWQAMDRTRPGDLERLRTDPGLRFERAFGANGDNTTSPEDDSEVAERERNLAPVEVYAVRDAEPGLDVEPVRPPVLVSGSGEAWAGLAELGLLEGTGPVRYTPDLTAAEATEALEAGGEVVVTDTNRRRLTVVSGFEVDRSRTLAAGEDLDRPTRSLFDAPGSESVARYPDATIVAAGGSERSVDGFTPWQRPSQAFDGDADTAWVTPRFEDPVGRVIGVDLREPTEISSVRVVDARQLLPGAQVTQVAVELSDGTVIPVSTASGTGEVELDEPVETEWVRVRITAAQGNITEGVGLAEVDLGLDLAEQVQVPDDLLRQADGDAALAAALADAPLTYSFRREVGDGPAAEETAVRRRFRTPAERTYDLAGTIGIDARTPDDVVDGLIGGEVGASATARHEGELTGHGGLAVDGDPATAWRSPGRTGEVLTTRFPSRVVEEVRVVAEVGPGRSDPTSVEVVVGDQTATAPFVVEPGCDPAEEDCTASAVVGVAPTEASGAQVRVTTIDVEVEGISPLPMEISEVQVDGEPNPPRSLAAPFASGCADLGVEVDGEARPVAVEARVADLLAGDEVGFRGCEPLVLEAGWHEVDAGSDVPVDRVTLSSPGADGQEGAASAASAAAEPSLEVLDRDPTEVVVEVDAPDGALLSLGESFDERWVASVDGEELGRASSFDTLSGWVVPATDEPVEVRLTYRPQRLFEVALALTLVGLAACVALLVRRRPARGAR